MTSPHTLIVGCGYLGTRVARLLTGEGQPVTGTVRSARRAEELRALGITPVIADVLDPASLTALPAADRALYCVGYDRSAGGTLRSVYVDGLRRALDHLAGRVGRLVHASSTGVYGPSAGDLVDEETPTVPQHESGRVVLEAEEVLRELAAERNLPVVVLRFSGLYGPGRVPRKASLERGEPVVGDPERPLNMIHIDDAAAAAVAALDRGQPGRTYLVSDDRPLPRRVFYTLAAELLGAPPPRFVAPDPASPEGLRESSSKRVDNRRLRTELNVALRYPDVTVGLPDAVGHSAP